MTHVNQVTLYCEGKDAEHPHRRRVFRPVHITDPDDSGNVDVVGTSQFATPIVNARPITQVDAATFIEQGHYRLKIRCPACNLTDVYDNPDDLHQLLAAVASRGESLQPLVKLISYHLQQNR